MILLLMLSSCCIHKFMSSSQCCIIHVFFALCIRFVEVMHRNVPYNCRLWVVNRCSVNSCELRKYPPTFTFIWGLIWSACAKGKCCFAKDCESKRAPRKSRKMIICKDVWCQIGDLVRKLCERSAKVARKLRCPKSRGSLLQEVHIKVQKANLKIMKLAMSMLKMKCVAASM